MRLNSASASASASASTKIRRLPMDFVLSFFLTFSFFFNVVELVGMGGVVVNFVRPMIQFLPWKEECSAIWLGRNQCIQPCFLCKLGNGKELKLCWGCAHTCHFGELRLHDSVGAMNEQFSCECCNDGHECLYEQRVREGSALLSDSDKAKFLLELHAQVLNAVLSPISGLLPGEREFFGRICHMCQQSEHYVNPSSLAAARAVIPITDILCQASALENDNCGPEQSITVALLAWFKQSFFTWMDKPKCSQCNSNAHVQALHGTAVAPTPEERQTGNASRVEVYQCMKHPHLSEEDGAATLRFPRYENPLKLLETRTGRCGEWANCFALCAAAMGLVVRIALDWTDHVWVEVLVESPRPVMTENDASEGKDFDFQWCMADACENVFNSPLLYEQGWNKKLSYIIAISTFGVTDQSNSYTADFEQLLPRRTALTETALTMFLHSYRTFLWNKNRHKLCGEAQKRCSKLVKEQAKAQAAAAGAGSTTALPGRTSGSAAWRRARGEDLG